MLFLPRRFYGAFDEGSISATDESSGEELEVMFTPPRQLEGLGPFFEGHELKPNDAVRLRLEEGTLVLGVVLRERRSQPDSARSSTSGSPAGQSPQSQEPRGPASRGDPSYGQELEEQHLQDDAQTSDASGTNRLKYESSWGQEREPEQFGIVRERRVPAPEKAAQDRAAQEQAAQQQAAQEREQAAQEYAARERALLEREAQEREAQEREAQEREALQRAARERAEQEEIAQQRAAQEQEAQERAARERERAAEEFAARERAVKQREAHERAAQRAAEEKAAQGRAAQERLAQQQAAKEREVRESEARQREAEEREAEEREAQEREVQEREARQQAARQREQQESAAREEGARERTATQRVVDAELTAPPTSGWQKVLHDPAPRRTQGVPVSPDELGKVDDTTEIWKRSRTRGLGGGASDQTASNQSTGNQGASNQGVGNRGASKQSIGNQGASKQDASKQAPNIRKDEAQSRSKSTAPGTRSGQKDQSGLTPLDAGGAEAWHLSPRDLSRATDARENQGEDDGLWIKETRRPKAAPTKPLAPEAQPEVRSQPRQDSRLPEAERRQAGLFDSAAQGEAEVGEEREKVAVGANSGNSSNAASRVGDYLRDPGTPAIVRAPAIAESLGLPLGDVQRALEDVSRSSEGSVTPIRADVYLVKRHRKEE